MTDYLPLPLSDQKHVIQTHRDAAVRLRASHPDWIRDPKVRRHCMAGRGAPECAGSLSTLFRLVTLRFLRIAGNRADLRPCSDGEGALTLSSNAPAFPHAKPPVSSLLAGPALSHEDVYQRSRRG